MPAQSSEVTYVSPSSVFSPYVQNAGGLCPRSPTWTSRHGESPAPTGHIVLSYALRGTKPMYVWPASPMCDRDVLIRIR